MLFAIKFLNTIDIVMLSNKSQKEKLACQHQITEDSDCSKG